MSRDIVLSSEQALDDYFAALLDESNNDLELAQENTEESLPQYSQGSEVVPQLQKQRVTEEPKSEESYTLPNLEDVQRLLSQLETTNPVDDIENIEELLEKNTDKIASQILENETASTSVDEVVETVVKQQTQVEEVQEWDIHVQSDDVVEVKTEVVVEAEPEVVETIETIEEVEEVKETEEELQVVPEQFEEPVSATSEQISSQEQNTAEDEVQAQEQKEIWKNVTRQESFQILYFEVNGVMFAVPLDELGGIHRLETLNHLIGRPQWYLGLQTNRDNQLDVVDTASWVMADKLMDDNYKSGYQYIVMLGDSSWGLACDHLRGTEWLETEKVRWREKAGKRPWLAGMVKERMCALIHVEALIGMLKAGLDVKALDN